uniref:Uncharacterized protein n=1 Tax=Steinernema glaseri TaxID=37863 RepID=A0A1I7ZS47_9BILA
MEAMIVNQVELVSMARKELKILEVLFGISEADKSDVKAPIRIEPGMALDCPFSIAPLASHPTHRLHYLEYIQNAIPLYAPASLKCFGCSEDNSKSQKKLYTLPRFAFDIALMKRVANHGSCFEELELLPAAQLTFTTFPVGNQL